MIKNIPNKYDAVTLLKKFDERHKDRYDFFHLPWDFSNTCNRGYAFMNFTHPVYVLDFYDEFNGKSWKEEFINSKKVVALTYASTQGKQSNYDFYKEKEIMKCSTYAPKFWERAPPNEQDVNEVRNKFYQQYMAASSFQMGGPLSGPLP